MKGTQLLSVLYDNQNLCFGVSMPLVIMFIGDEIIFLIHLFFYYRLFVNAILYQNYIHLILNQFIGKFKLTQFFL